MAPESASVVSADVTQQSESEELPPVQLKYPAGELIVKEGDYGISIYRVMEGKLGVFIESADGDSMVSTLGEGELLGEMVFLSGNKIPRTASVRALEDSVLEAWHPSRIAREYDSMPFIGKYITQQMVNHLIRMDRRISAMAEIEVAKERTQAEAPPAENRRSDYRKPVDLKCLYRPIDTPAQVRLWGRVQDISKGGIRMDIRRINASDFDHKPGDEFVANTILPNGKKVKFRLRVANANKKDEDWAISLGMQFIKIDEESLRNLGFFLLG